MEWIASLIRAVGSSFPGAASLVQLNSEIESNAIKKRIDKLEDPISSLHPDIQKISAEIYSAVKVSNANAPALSDEFYDRARRPLATLESSGAIRGEHALGRRYAAGLRITDPSYMLYMAALNESSEKMLSLIKTVDECSKGKWLDGDKIAEDIGVPSPVVRAVFEIFRDKGYGLLSGELGSNKYMSKV